MDPLRLIILFAGLAIIVGIYLRFREPAQPHKRASEAEAKSVFTSLKQLLSKRDAYHDDRMGPEISLEDVDSLGSFKAHGGDVGTEELQEGMHIGWDSMTPVDPKDECLIVFNILAKPGEQFSGQDIQSAATQSGFSLGDLHVFDYRSSKMSNKGLAVCSFANAVEPGHFAALESDEFASPGISLFAQLPGPLEARETFNVTLEKAHDLASSLGGILCDESRSILSEQAVSHIKEKVEAFRFKQQMAAMKHRRH